MPMPGAATFRARGVAPSRLRPVKAARDSASARKLHAAMNIAPTEVAELQGEAASFLTAQDRPALIWPRAAARAGNANLG